MGLRVLLAEDNPVNQKVARRLLEKWGCQVDCVTDGGEAVAAWANTTFDAVLMDVQMPVMDGYEATAEIRRREQGRGLRVPIIAMTAHAMAGDEQRCLDVGMDDYVAKPVNPEVLREKLLKWTGRPAAVDVTATPSQPAEAVFDADRLEELCGPDVEFRRELLSDFLDLAPQLLARMESSITTGNAPELANASHSLKGSSRTLGAGALGGVCQELESLGKDGALDQARDTLERARREFARLQTALQAYLPVAAPA
jgi:CheY-like chemotaxis protein